MLVLTETYTYSIIIAKIGIPSDKYQKRLDAALTSSLFWYRFHSWPLGHAMIKTKGGGAKLFWELRKVVWVLWEIRLESRQTEGWDHLFLSNQLTKQTWAPLHFY